MYACFSQALVLSSPCLYYPMLFRNAAHHTQLLLQLRAFCDKLNIYHAACSRSTTRKASTRHVARYETDYTWLRLFFEIL